MIFFCQLKTVPFSREQQRPGMESAFPCRIQTHKNIRLTLTQKQNRHTAVSCDRMGKEAPIRSRKRTFAACGCSPVPAEVCPAAAICLPVQARPAHGGLRHKKGQPRTGLPLFAEIFTCRSIYFPAVCACIRNAGVRRSGMRAPGPVPIPGSRPSGHSGILPCLS